MKMISENFTVKDIHAIRYANYERTKNMSSEELIEDTKRRAEKIRIKIRGQICSEKVNSVAKCL